MSVCIIVEVTSSASTLERSKESAEHTWISAFRESLPSPWERNEAHLDGPVELSGHVTNTGKGYLVDGVLRAMATLTCDRCLEPFQAEITGEVREEFHPQSAPTGRDFAHDDEDGSGEEQDREEWNLFQGEAFSLDEVVYDHLVLALPTKLLCRPECKGICSRCGQNQNFAVCSCPSEDLDPRMAALLDLLKSDQ